MTLTSSAMDVKPGSTRIPNKILFSDLLSCELPLYFIQNPKMTNSPPVVQKMPSETKSFSVTKDIESQNYEKKALSDKSDSETFLGAYFEMSTVDAITKFTAEVIATALLLFTGCMGCLTWGKELPGFFGALAFGLTVMILIQCFGAISGAHLNPAVTVAALIFKLISVPMAILYFVAQMIGAVIGYGLLKTLTPAHVFDENAKEYGFCTTAPDDSVTPFQAFMMEFIATMILIIICCSVWDPRNAKHQESVALKFGFAITLLSFTFGPFTGCSMNPARTFGPALWNGNFVMHWIYWIAPMSSAVITAITYKVFFWREQPILLSQHDDELNRF